MLSLQQCALAVRTNLLVAHPLCCCLGPRLATTVPWCSRQRFQRLFSLKSSIQHLFLLESSSSLLPAATTTGSLIDTRHIRINQIETCAKKWSTRPKAKMKSKVKMWHILPSSGFLTKHRNTSSTCLKLLEETKSFTLKARSILLKNSSDLPTRTPSMSSTIGLGRLAP